MDYHKLNLQTTPIAASIPDMVLLLEQIHTSPSTSIQLLIWQITFPPYLSKGQSKVIFSLPVRPKIHLHCPTSWIDQLSILIFQFSL